MQVLSKHDVLALDPKLATLLEMPWVFDTPRGNLTFGTGLLIAVPVCGSSTMVGWTLLGPSAAISSSHSWNQLIWCPEGPAQPSHIVLDVVCSFGLPVAYDPPLLFPLIQEKE